MWIILKRLPGVLELSTLLGRHQFLILGLKVGYQPENINYYYKERLHIFSRNKNTLQRMWVILLSLISYIKKTMGPIIVGIFIYSGSKAFTLSVEVSMNYSSK